MLHKKHVMLCSQTLHAVHEILLRTNVDVMARVIPGARLHYAKLQGVIKTYLIVVEESGLHCAPLNEPVTQSWFEHLLCSRNTDTH